MTNRKRHIISPITNNLHRYLLLLHTINITELSSYSLNVDSFGNNVFETNRPL